VRMIRADKASGSSRKASCLVTRVGSMARRMIGYVTRCRHGGAFVDTIEQGLDALEAKLKGGR
jgi:hypothetical protein